MIVLDDAEPAVLGEPVQAYRNLSVREGRLYSVRLRGRLIARVQDLWLYDVTFRVRPGGRRRALREGVRNVHAFVSGTAVSLMPRGLLWQRASYNPFLTDRAGFFLVESGQEVSAARYARLDQEGCFVVL